MTVMELLDITTSEVWITTAELTNSRTPEVRVRSMTKREEKEFLSKEILYSEINTISAPCENVVYVSLYWDRVKED